MSIRYILFVWSVVVVVVLYRCSFLSSVVVNAKSF